MPIEVTVHQVLLAYPALEKINSENKLPQTASWRVGRLIDKLRVEVERYQKQRADIIKDNGDRNDKGDFELRKTAEAREAFELQHDELLEVPVKIDYDPIPLTLFKRKVKDKEGNSVDEDIELFGSDLSRCVPFFTEK